MRTLVQVIRAHPTQDGAGVKIHRVAGQALNAILDPFLMIDEINSDNADDYIAGFPEHPHRGFETITYMKAGKMRHRDHMGNAGVIESGGVQWMTAGRGVLHSEIPEQESGLLHGFQIWLNLPSHQKMVDPDYKDIRPDAMGRAVSEGVADLSVVAGQLGVFGEVLDGPIRGRMTQPLIADLEIAPNRSVSLSTDLYDSVLVLVYRGQTSELSTKTLGVYGPGSELCLRSGEEGASALILAGKPIKEPIVQYGPFVMNTEQQIRDAIMDYRAGRLAG
ncbi:MAG: pirin family protein [Aequoribacter sp.]|uniref:pirin family protein n=1 Tax=Aequoribacter sp. TaxID=2847771 RepID=UPI003C54C9E1